VIFEAISVSHLEKKSLYVIK